MAIHIHIFNNNIKCKGNDLLNLVPCKLDFQLPLTIKAIAIDLAGGKKNGNSLLDKSKNR